MARDKPVGLSAAEVERRLASEGPNELPRQGARGLGRIVADVLREPMFGLLLAAGVVYLILGDRVEALALLAFASTSVLITIVQENRSERVLDALRDLTSPRALVIREGERKRIPGREVVRGDLVVLSEGDRVPADARLLQSEDLQADESLLTGEAIPVRKRRAEPGEEPELVPGGDDLPAVFSGSLIVRGQGIAEVFATGARSQIGRIGQSLAGIERTAPRLSREIRFAVQAVAAFGLACCILVVVLFGLFRGSWLEAALAGIALGMSMLPEEFPLVLAVFMVMGAWRLSRARVLTRRATAIEALGAATVLCTDKTGTLTENRMSVVELRTLDAQLRPDDAEAEAWTEPLLALLEDAILASAAAPFDPMDKARHDTFQEVRSGTPVPVAGKSPWRVYPIRPDLLAVTYVWDVPESGALSIAAKGAPEAVLELCKLDPETSTAIRRSADEMAASGVRVLAVAKARAARNGLPDDPHEFAFAYAGLVGFADPLRESVPAAVRECHEAGIRVVMITGDYPQTARAVAAEAGLPSDNVVSGQEMKAMSDEELSETAARTCVFARVMPELKLRLVEALKGRREVVAMTGDGVNDAPALKAAEIGIAMGGRGTDVAREAASIVLLDDDFDSIVRTIRGGRRIYDNLRKAIAYILSIHIPIAGMALLPLLTGQPLVFLPIHIAFLEMVIDPVCSVVFEAEAEEEDIMRRPPRPLRAHLISRRLVAWSILQGTLALGIVAILYFESVREGLAAPEVRAVTFVSLVLVNLGLVLVNRTFGLALVRPPAYRNLALWWVSGLALGLLAIAVLWPPAKSLFQFDTFDVGHLGYTFVAAAALVGILEAVKYVWGRRRRAAVPRSA